VAIGQNSGNRPPIDRTASNPAATSPDPETTCIALRQSSAVRPGWTARTSTAVRSIGSIAPPGSAAATSAAVARQRGQAPSNSTRSGGAPGSAANPRSQAPGTNARFAVSIARLNSARPGLIAAIPRCIAATPISVSGRVMRIQIKMG
jgi:hypothetical protein